jgi:redox-regulated HSP33 family molecular chaperone
MLPDESFSSYFLDVFGRPQRISACECERSSEANLAQALQMLNSDEVQGKIARQGGRASMLAKDPRPDAEKIEELWLWTFGRKPTQEDLNHALAHIEKMKTKNTTQVGYENIVWALLNSKEFAFNR